MIPVLRYETIKTTSPFDWSSKFVEFEFKNKISFKDWLAPIKYSGENI